MGELQMSVGGDDLRRKRGLGCGVVLIVPTVCGLSSALTIVRRVIVNLEARCLPCKSLTSRCYELSRSVRGPRDGKPV